MIRPRLTVSGRGLGASVTIGPLRITRSGSGRFSFSLRVPRANGRARGPRPGAWPPPQGAPLTPTPGCPVCATGSPWAGDPHPEQLCDGHAEQHAMVTALQARGRRWPAPQGPRLAGPREGA